MKLKLIRLLILALGAIHFSALAAAPVIRIMPVGDSITVGIGSPGGYRAKLYQLLTNAGYNVDFVGMQNGNCTNTLPDCDHEGHSGWLIANWQYSSSVYYQGIDSIIDGSLDQVEDPDVILLLIGTNDYGVGYDTPNAINRLDALITKIATNRPGAKIIVGNLLQRAEPLNSQIQATFNAYLPNPIVANQRALGREVYFDDIRSAVPLSDMPDQLHPNQAGNDKMGTNWFAAITNLFPTPYGSTNAPTIARVVGAGGLTNVVVVFSKPVADSAANISNYSLSGGLSILSASLDPVGQRKVTLTTTVQQPQTSYTLTVNGGVTDLTPNQTPLAANTTATFQSSAARGVLNNVAEAANCQLVYSLDIPNAASYPNNVRYDIDLRAYATNFSRVAYYLELQRSGGPLRYLWASMDKFTTNASLLGVPTLGSGAVFQQSVTNLNVFANVQDIVTGSNLSGGNLEFWPWGYQGTNSLRVLNASDYVFDWGDMPSGNGNYGSMQLGNGAAGQMLFSFNNWGGAGGNADLGLGNAPTGVYDWTFAHNAADYTVKTLQVYVQPASIAGAPVLASAAGQPGATNVVLLFSKALENTATNTGCYAISGGLSVLNATLDPMTKLAVTLTTTAQQPGTTYTVTVNGVSDRQSHTAIVPNSTASFQTARVRGATNNVAEAANYQLVYSLDIPNAPLYTNDVVYNIDRRGAVTNINRIAYYLELQQSGGSLDYIWVSLAPFTTNVNKIGVPTVGSGAFFQQAVTKMTVLSSVAGIVNGTNLSGGWMEFWPWNYGAASALNVTNASGSAFDWGDTSAGNGNYGSMQLANAAAGQMLLSFNRWGGFGGTADVGIGNGPTGYLDWTFQSTAANYTVKTLQVFVRQGAAGSADGSWAGGASGNWSDPANWTADVAGGPGATAYFTNLAGSAINEDVPNLTIGNLYFGNSDYTVANNTITLDNSGHSGAPMVTVGGTATATIGSVLAGTNGITKAGAGTLTLTAPAAYGGATLIQQGTVQLSPGVSPPADAVIHYDFDSSHISGGTVANLGTGGSALDGIAAAGVTFAPGNRGQAASFPGGNGVYISTVANVSLGNAFTYSTWISTTAGSQGCYPAIISGSAYNNASFFGMSCGTYGNDFLFIDYGGPWVVPPNVTPGLPLDNSGAWHMVTFVETGSSTMIYYDGALFLSTSYGVQPSGSYTGKLYFGGNLGNASFNGLLDEAYVFNRALSSTEVAALYNQKSGQLPSASTVQVASNATLNLNGISQTVASLADYASGGGLVTNGGSHPLVFTINTPSNVSGTFSGAITDGGTGTGITLVKSGAGLEVLAGTCACSGGTIVSNGTLLVNGSLGGAVTIYGGYFGGSGTVGGVVKVQSGATLEPGNNGIGTLSVSGDVSFQAGSTYLVGINRASSPNSGGVLWLSNVTEGGTLIVTNVGGNLLAGDTFTLLSGASFSNSFNSVVLPNYYRWDTSQLALNGTIRVAAVAPPVISGVDVSGLAGGIVTLSASNGVAGGVVSVLTSTDMSLPLSRWTTLSTGNFDGSGNCSFHITVDREAGRNFFLLQAR